VSKCGILTFKEISKMGKNQVLEYKKMDKIHIVDNFRWVVEQAKGDYRMVMVIFLMVFTRRDS